MVFDLTFKEAMDVLKNRLGWVQGENFDKHEYLAIDRRRGFLIKNGVYDDTFGCVFDFWGDQTREVWPDMEFLQNEYKTQRYRFILVLNRDSVKGIGAFSNGNKRDSYLQHKNINKPRE